jgi:hypothetical protein
MHYRTIIVVLAPLCVEALRLTSSDASHGMNLTAQKHFLQLSNIDKPLVHILSMGRVGSCFTLSIYAACGFKTVFEPLNGIVEGSGVLSPTNAKVFDCLYGCECDGHVVNAGAEQIMNEYCLNPSGRLAIKDCRVINYEAYQTYSHPQFLENVKYVLLLRDPRGVWESVMKYPGWAIHSIPLVCNMLYMQLQTLPNLREAVGSSNILIEILEKWSLNATAFVQRLAAFSGQEPSQEALEQAAKAQAQHGPDGAGKWYDRVSAHDIQLIESDPKCSAYMDSMGYKKGSNDYSQVTDPSLLISNDINLPLSSAHVDDPAHLSIEELVNRLPEEVLETLMPSKMPSFPTIED